MDVELQSNSLRSFDLIREAAREYNNEEFKFFTNGFIKYKVENKSVFVSDIYIRPEYRGTPVSSMMLASFTDFLKENKIHFVYGYVMRGSPKFTKRINTFDKWGLKVTESLDTHVMVSCLVSNLKQIEESDE